jgi:hypothetical protein
MKKIIEDLGGVFDSGSNNRKPETKIEITPEGYNSPPDTLEDKWIIFLQFDDDKPMPFAFIDNGKEMTITFKEPALLKEGEKAPTLIFGDTRTNKRMRIFSKKGF